MNRAKALPGNDTGCEKLTFDDTQHGGEGREADRASVPRTPATVTSIADARKTVLVDQFVKCYFDALVVDDELPESLSRLMAGMR